VKKKKLKELVENLKLSLLIEHKTGKSKENLNHTFNQAIINSANILEIIFQKKNPNEKNFDDQINKQEESGIIKFMGWFDSNILIGTIQFSERNMENRTRYTVKVYPKLDIEKLSDYIKLGCYLYNISIENGINKDLDLNDLEKNINNKMQKYRPSKKKSKKDSNDKGKKESQIDHDEEISSENKSSMEIEVRNKKEKNQTDNKKKSKKNSGGGANCRRATGNKYIKQEVIEEPEEVMRDPMLMDIDDLFLEMETLYPIIMEEEGYGNYIPPPPSADDLGLLNDFDLFEDNGSLIF